MHLLAMSERIIESCAAFVFAFWIDACALMNLHWHASGRLMIGDLLGLGGGG